MDKDYDSKLDKDKEAFFNVAYNVTDNNSSRVILRHNNIFNRYLPDLLYPPSTAPFMRALAMELLVPFFTPLVLLHPLFVGFLCCNRSLFYFALLCVLSAFMTALT